MPSSDSIYSAQRREREEAPDDYWLKLSKCRMYRKNVAFFNFSFWLQNVLKTAVLSFLKKHLKFKRAPMLPEPSANTFRVSPLDPRWSPPFFWNSTQNGATAPICSVAQTWYVSTHFLCLRVICKRFCASGKKFPPLLDSNLLFTFW